MIFGQTVLLEYGLTLEEADLVSISGLPVGERIVTPRQEEEEQGDDPRSFSRKELGRKLRVPSAEAAPTIDD
jgi:hypothetical protein